MSATVRTFRSIFWTLAVAGLILDLGTKFAAFGLLEPGEAGRIEVIPKVFSLLRQERLNQGALFGLANTPESGKIANIVFAVVSGVAVIAISWWSFRPSMGSDRLLCMSLGLITGGAAGNCFDRIAIGGVRDFLWVYYERGPGDYPWPAINPWPVFNLADAWLVIGAILLLLQAFLHKPVKPEAAPSRDLVTTAASAQTSSTAP